MANIEITNVDLGSSLLEADGFADGTIAFGGADIYSSLRMPSGVAPLVVLDPEGAALAAAKILALGDSELSKKIAAYQRKIGEEVERSDRKVNR